MSTVAVDVSAELYAYYQGLSRRYGIPVSRLINQALEREKFQREVRESRDRIARSTRSLMDHEPLSVGKILKPLGPRSEWIDEFFDRGEGDGRR